VIITPAIGWRKSIAWSPRNSSDDYVTKPFGLRELLARVRAFCGGTSWGASPERASRSGADTDSRLALERDHRRLISPSRLP